MSVDPQINRMTAPDIMARKGKEPIVCLTSYHSHTAALVDPFCDLLLVGDSLGMVMYGMSSTIGVTLEQMKLHGAAVVRGSKKSLVVVDMPFGTFEESPQIAYRNASYLMRETGCGAVKLEGGAPMAETIRFLTDRGIPVVAHIGLMPQQLNTLGGFKSQGRKEGDRERLINDAKAIQEAGAFAVVLEGILEPIAAEITEIIDIPTIGIGASAECDGQILVMEDMLGLNPWVPKFVKKFGALGDHIAGAAEDYAREVKSRRFPSDEHVYRAKKK